MITFILTGCSANPKKSGQVMQIVKLRTSLNDEEFIKIAHEREPQFAANPAIIQKYYIKLNEPGYYGGVYIWESAEALREFKESKLAKSIPEAYSGIEKPTIEIVDIIFQLRE
jgi:hypothetical protein